MRYESASRRIGLACHILYESVARRPAGISDDEIAQLRGFAESDEERRMDLDELARLIVYREQVRLEGLRRARATAA